MSCRRCGSCEVKGFNGELGIHFSGWEGLEKPLVWAFPELMICQDCGFVEFELPAKQLMELTGGDFGTQSRAHTWVA
jgi:hypothetical protein